MTYGMDPRDLDRIYREAMTPRRLIERGIMVLGLLALFGMMVAGVLLGG